jgi:dihydrofolate synthase / folylpolyglutamate synthase
MTYADAIRFLYSLRWFGAKFGLENTFKLAALAGNPQNQLRFIHVAGTNGKGSTCAMLESIYRAAGLRVGLFTSPHLVAFGERIQVNRKLIGEDDVARLVVEMSGLLEQGWGHADAATSTLASADDRHVEPTAAPPHSASEHPTFFEVVTVMALRYFAEQKCDLVIWETGLGGRLDATNIITPLAGIITNIQYDHQKWLGETLASIGAEKAGIIKPGIPVVTGTEAPDALAVIEQTARNRNAPLVVVPPSETNRPPLDTIELPLLGHHQRMNAAVALAAVRVLDRLIPVGEDAIRNGLGRIHWPGRLQSVLLPSGQRVLLDGAHNVSGAEIFAAAFREFFPAVRPALVLGILRDKDWPAMCETLAPLAGRILLVPVHSERTAEPHGLAEVCCRANPSAQVVECASLAAALADTDADSFVAIAGSLYLIGEAMELLRLSPVKASDERGLNEWSGALQRRAQGDAADPGAAKRGEGH